MNSRNRIWYSDIAELAAIGESSVAKIRKVIRQNDCCQISAITESAIANFGYGDRD